MAIQLKAGLAQHFGGVGIVADEYIDVETTALRLNLSASFLNKARVTGDGPPFCKFAKSVRYHWPSVVAWANSRSRSSTSEEAA
jgi:hypothetical protein